MAGWGGGDHGRRPPRLARLYGRAGRPPPPAPRRAGGGGGGVGGAIPVERWADGTARPRDIAALTYAANPHKKGLDRVLAAWAAARREGEELVVAGADLRLGAPGVRVAGRLEPAD